MYGFLKVSIARGVMHKQHRQWAGGKKRGIEVDSGNQDGTVEKERNLGGGGL